MKELLEEYLGKKIISFMYRESNFGHSEPYYRCFLEDNTDATVETSEIYSFLYKLVSKKYPKTLDKLSDNNEEIWYRLTSNTAIYYGGESLTFNVGSKFRLAGFELSKHTNSSPFHYNDEIIRLPNVIVKKIENEH